MPDRDGELHSRWLSMTDETTARAVSHMTEALPFADLCLDCSALLSLSGQSEQAWTKEAIALLTGDGRRSADTHLVKPNFPGLPGIDVYFKDESTHPTGSLKHRLARSLFLYGICNGAIRQGTTLVEASSGSTAVSEAYFAQFLKLPFIAVMPRTTSP